jgi:hypothetical protein
MGCVMAELLLGQVCFHMNSLILQDGRLHSYHSVFNTLQLTFCLGFTPRTVLILWLAILCLDVSQAHELAIWSLAFVSGFGCLQLQGAGLCLQPLFPGESGVDQLVEIIKVLGTPTREEIKCMNPNYTEFKFPQIKAHPWHKVCSLWYSLSTISANVIFFPPRSFKFHVVLPVDLVILYAGVSQTDATWSSGPGLKASSILSKPALQCGMFSVLAMSNCLAYFCEWNVNFFVDNVDKSALLLH